MRFILFFLPFLFIGCGYKNSYYYQQKILSTKISPKVNISIQNPKESIFLKDALIDAIYTVFRGEIKKDAKTKIEVNLNGFSLDAIDYDKNSYPILYRSKVYLRVKLIDKYKKVHFYTINGSYDFAIQSNTVINETTKLEAFKIASINALNQLLVEITKDGVNYDNKRGS